MKTLQPAPKRLLAATEASRQEAAGSDSEVEKRMSELTRIIEDTNEKHRAEAADRKSRSAFNAALSTEMNRNSEMALAS